MAIFGNFKGTTQPSFTIGKRGPTIFGTPSDGLSGEPVSPVQSNFWFDPANYELKVYSTVSSNVAWRSIGAHLSELNVDNGTLFVDKANDTVSIGSTSSNEKLFVNGSLRLGTNPSIKYSGAYLDLQHSNGTGSVIRIRDNNTGTSPVFKVYSANNTSEVFKVQGTSITVANSYVLPNADGVNGQAIVTDGNGNLSFSSVSALVPAVGSNTQLQFNDGGSFGASANLTFDKATNQLYVNGILAVGSISFNNGASISTAAGNSNVDLTAGTGGYAGLSTSDANVLAWVESQGMYIASNYLGTQNIWHFDPSGNISLPRGAKIAANAGSGNVDITAGAGGYAGVTSYNSNTSVWAENDAAYVATDLTGSVKLWEFNNAGNMTLPGNPKLVTLGTANLDIYAGSNTGYVALTSFNNNTTMWVENTGAYISTDFGNAQHSWSFDSTGNLTLPRGASLSTSAGNSNVDLTAGVGGYAALTSNNGNTTIWVENDSAYIATDFTGSQFAWEFGNAGVLSLPGNLNVNSHKIINVVDPTSDQDAATKKYVDDQVSGSSGTGVVTGVIFVPITDYGLITSTANMTVDFGSILDPASYTSSYDYVVDAKGIIHEAYTVAHLPSPSVPGQMIYVSNESGGATMAFSDGANWRRITDRAIVS
jgi:hypothetical protein